MNNIDKEESKNSPGTLYLVATPIGNLDDITLRALSVLKSSDLVAAEDTRRTRKLLSHFDIHTRLISYREHNKVFQGKKMLEMLQSGQSIALCSDAGMPIISDPGEDFVGLCIKHNVPVTVIPGANAALTALVMSGFSANSFLYLGFIPRHSKKRREFLKGIAGEPHTLIFYESPFRIVDLLVDLREVLGERNACAARELTKIHEEALRGTFSKLIDEMKGKNWKGEFTLVVEGAAPDNSSPYFDPEAVVEEAREMIALGAQKMKAFKLLADKYKTSKRAIYELFIDRDD